MILSQIAAMARNRVIGQKGVLPWHIPEDLQYFQKTTRDHIVVMGRKTYESIGKPLPKRLNVVITRQKDFSAPGCQVFSDIESALQFCRAQQTEPAYQDKEVFIIGGGELYKALLPMTEKIYLTEIDREFVGDAQFPEFKLLGFKEKYRRMVTGDPNYSFVIYEKNLQKKNIENNTEII